MLNQKETKRCSSCQKELFLEFFSKNAKRADGLQTFCKACQKEKYYNNKQSVPQQARPGKSLAEKNPELLSEWDYDKNKIEPHFISAGTTFVVWWKCPKKHSYSTPIQQRTRKIRPLSCSICYADNKSKIPYEESIAFTNPDMVSWWSSKNDFYCSDVKRNSISMVLWNCQNGHLFKKRIKSFNYSCPECNFISISVHEDLMEEWDFDKNLIEPQKISYNSAKEVFWKCKNKHSWRTKVYQRVNSKSNCPYCSNNGVSNSEKEIVSYVSSLIDIDKVILNDRKILDGLELDLYIPDKNIAIEFNGLFWHSENKVGKNYHYNKWSKCAEKNIQLITVWEDDWNNRKEIIKNMISYKLGCFSGEKVYARKTFVKSVSYKEASDFLNANHIQGNVQGTSYFGLVFDDNLVAVSVWTKRENILSLVRYATSCQVVGGMSKLLKYAINFYGDSINFVTTFANHEVSNGGLYEKLGFVLENNIKSDYSYVVDKQRVHKFNYRLKRFRDDPSLEYVDGFSESQLARLNKIDRVWDCGKSKYVMHL